MSNAIRFAEYSISSGVGSRWGRNHNGTDYAVPLNTEIQTVTGGTVIFTGYDADGYGNYIKVQDYSGNVHTYAHLNSIDTAKGESVEAGEVINEWVTAGQQIGKGGNTGRSTGPHLHYEVRDTKGNVLDGQGFIEGFNINQIFDNTEAETEGTDTGGLVQKIVSACVLMILAGLAFLFLTKAFS